MQLHERYIDVGEFTVHHGLERGLELANTFPVEKVSTGI